MKNEEYIPIIDLNFSLFFLIFSLPIQGTRIGMVGVEGFEPPAPWSQTMCASQTALNPADFVQRALKRTYLKRILYMMFFVNDFK